MSPSVSRRKVPLPSAGGRPRDAALDAAIRAAALDGLAELGYDRLTMDEIAARARAGKGALYRRWPSKAALVVDAMVTWRAQIVPVTVPDTGSLIGDLNALIAAIPDFDDATRRQMAVLVGLAGAAARDPELRDALTANLLERPRVLVTVLDRAVARGEIAADRNLDLVPDLLSGLNLVRVLRGAPLDRAFVRRVLLDVIHPMVTARSRPSTTGA